MICEKLIKSPTSNNCSEVAIRLVYLFTESTAAHHEFLLQLCDQAYTSADLHNHFEVSSKNEHLALGIISEVYNIISNVQKSVVLSC